MVGRTGQIALSLLMYSTEEEVQVLEKDLLILWRAVKIGVSSQAI